MDPTLLLSAQAGVQTEGANCVGETSDQSFEGSSEHSNDFDCSDFSRASRRRQQEKENEEEECSSGSNSYGANDRRRLKAPGKARGKSNRLVVQMSRAGGGGRELINSLREYLASRNVINRTERYEKIGGGSACKRDAADSETKLSSRGLNGGQETTAASGFVESVPTSDGPGTRTASGCCGSGSSSSSGSRSSWLKSSDHWSKSGKIYRGQRGRGKQKPKPKNASDTWRPTRSWLAANFANLWPPSQAPASSAPSALATATHEGAHYFIATTTTTTSNQNQNQLRPEQDANFQNQSQYQHQRQHRRQQVKKFNYNFNSTELGPMEPHKHGVCQLVKELFRAKRNNKLLLLVKLLRAPIVLAALFSFALALSLITLYTLSFHHCNAQVQAKRQQQQYVNTLNHHLNQSQEPEPLVDNGQDPYGNSSASQQVQVLGYDKIIFGRESNFSRSSVREITPASQSAAGVAEEHEKSHIHVINSRQLMAVAAAESERQQQLASTETNIGTGNDNYNIVHLQDQYRIETECATYLGRPDSFSGTGLVFAGIAYASPPINERRWRKPRPVWFDNRLCNSSRGKSRVPIESQQRAHCIQLSPFNRRVSGSEDCLYLDVYTPMNLSINKDKQLPVMVYIHGGLLAFGSSGHGQVNWMKARPSGQLATELNVILVAPNYRLQALGFMALRELAQINGPDGSEGNYGLWDQLVALNWIRRNIGSFGGNASNINLFGPDSASALPLALLSRRRPPRPGRPANGTRQCSGALSSKTTHETLPANDKVQSSVGTGEHDETTIGSLNKSTVTAAAGSSQGLGTNNLDGQQMKNSLHNSRSTCAGHDRDQSDRDGHGDDYNLEMDPNVLFRSVWLTNPSVYFGLPYARANGHYSRLIKSQSVCSAAAAATRGRVGEQEVDSKPDDATEPAGSLNATAATPTVGRMPPTVDAGQKGAKKLIECLMNLSAEQVVREFLGKDDPAFRLDDENSLPIRNIYPDQLVTVDGQLVHDSYPFDASIAAATAASESVDDGDGGGGGGKIKFLIGTTAQAVEYWPCPRNLHQWNWLDLERYVETSLNSFSQDTFVQASNVYRLPSGAANQKLVATAYANASAAAAAAPANASYNPIERYLTMVTDIRQTCPSHKLGDSLSRLTTTAQGGARMSLSSSSSSPVERYIVEWRPSSRLTRSMSPTTMNRSEVGPTLQPVHRRAPTLCKQCDKTYASGSGGKGSDAVKMAPDVAQHQSNNKGADDGVGIGRRQGAGRMDSEVTKSAKGDTLNRQGAGEALKYEQQADDEDEDEADGDEASGYIRPPMEYAFHYWDLLAFFGFEFETASGGGAGAGKGKQGDDSVASGRRPVGLEVGESDLDFQRLLRKMVRDFVHETAANELGPAATARVGAFVTSREPSHASGSESNSRSKRAAATYYSAPNSLSTKLGANRGGRRIRRGAVDETGNGNTRDTSSALAAGNIVRGGGGGEIANETKTAPQTFVLFTLDNKMERKLGEYKRVECNMWQQLLKQSYAWIS